MTLPVIVHIQGPERSCEGVLTGGSALCDALLLRLHVQACPALGCGALDRAQSRSVEVDLPLR